MDGGRRSTLKSISALIAFLILFSATVPVYAATINDLKSAESKLNATRAKIRQGEADKQRLSTEIKAADDQMTSLQNELNALDAQVAAARKSRNIITAELNRLRSELARTQGELDQAILKLRELTATLNRRAENAYKNGDVSFLEVLLEAEDFSDFISRARFLQTIMSKDASLVTDIKSTKGKIEGARAVIERDRAATQERENAMTVEVNRLAGLASSQLAKRNQVKAQIGAKEQLMTKIDQDKSSWLAAEAEFSASAARIRQQLSRATASPVVGTPSVSGFIWPAAGPISSGFGPRWGRMHEGIDISVPHGAPVVASKSGRVAIADWYGGYGKLVVIDHGGGVTTWYGHNSEFTVSVGQSVSQGQVIAKAGSTGRSTGPHVHFEVQIGGASKNPINYLP